MSQSDTPIPTEPDLATPVTTYGRRVEAVVKLLSTKLPHQTQHFDADLLNALGAAMVRHPESAVNRYYNQQLSAMYDAADRVQREKPVFHVDVSVTREQEANLVKLYPQFNLVFKGTDADQHRSHPTAYVSRKIEFKIMTTFIGKTNNSVTDIGGNYSWLSQYHSCCPVLSQRDAARYAMREQDLLAEYTHEMGKKHPDIRKVKALEPFYNARDIPFHDFSRREAFATRMRCFKRAEDCPVQSKYGICLHSAYDIKKKDIPKIMRNKGMEQLYGSMLYDTKMRNEYEGKLELLDTNYVIDPLRDTIEFFFHDASYSYTHQFSEYIKYGYTEELEYAGTKYLYRVIDRRPGLIMFTVTRIPPELQLLPPPTDVFFRTVNQRIVALHTFKINYRYALSDLRAYEPMVVYISEETFDTVLKRYMARDERTYTREQFALTLRTNNVRFLINGKTYTTGERVDVQEFNAIVTAMMIIAAREQTLNASKVSLTLDQVTKRRALFEGTPLMFKLISHGVTEMMRVFYDSVDKPLTAIRQYLAEQITGKYGDALLNVTNRYGYVRCVVEGGFTSAHFEQIHDVRNWSPETYEIKTEEEMYDDIVPDVELLKALLIHYVDDVGYDDAEPDIRLIKQLIDAASETEDVSHPAVQTSIDDVQPLRSMGIRRSDDAPRLVIDNPALLEAAGVTVDKKRLGDMVAASYEFPNRSDDDAYFVKYAVAAMDEAARYLEFQAESVKGDAQLHYGRSVIGSEYALPYMKAMANDEKSAPNFLLFDVNGRMSGSVLPVKERYMVGMTDDGIIEPLTYVREGSSHIAVVKRGVHRLFVYNQFVVYNALDIARKVRLLLDSPINVKELPSPEVHLTAGVAGCGKTTSIIEAVKKYDIADVLVVSPCREAADGARQRAIDAGIADMYTASQRFRTIDSYLMNSTIDDVKVLFVDEVFMALPGLVAAVMLKCGAPVMRAFGDRCQIPWINRLSGAISVELTTFDYFTTRIEANTTHRCPVDVCQLMRKFYSDEMSNVFTTSKVIKSMSVKKIRGCGEIPKKDDVQYITYYRSEANELRAKGYQNVNTVHEIQGATRKKVCAVRLERRKFSLYDNPLYHNVCGTRHTDEFTYYTVDDSDMLSRLVKGIHINPGMLYEYRPPVVLEDDKG